MDATICRNVYDDVSARLGVSFITPKQIEEVFGWKYSAEQNDTLLAALSDDVVETALQSDALLLPLPPTVRSLYALFSLGREGMVYRYRNYRYANETFTREGAWLLFPKRPNSNSVGLAYEDQCKLLVPGEVIPNAAEIAYVIVAFRAVHKEHCYVGVYLRSSTQYMLDCNVAVGCSEGEISMQDMYNGARLENVQFAAATFI